MLPLDKELVENFNAALREHEVDTALLVYHLQEIEGHQTICGILAQMGKERIERLDKMAEKIKSQINA